MTLHEKLRTTKCLQVIVTKPRSLTWVFEDGDRIVTTCDLASRADQRVLAMDGASAGFGSREVLEDYLFGMDDFGEGVLLDAQIHPSIWHDPEAGGDPLES